MVSCICVPCLKLGLLSVNAVLLEIGRIWGNSSAGNSIESVIFFLSDNCRYCFLFFFLIFCCLLFFMMLPIQQYVRDESSFKIFCFSSSFFSPLFNRSSAHLVTMLFFIVSFSTITHRLRLVYKRKRERKKKVRTRKLFLICKINGTSSVRNDSSLGGWRIETMKNY